MEKRTAGKLTGVAAAVISATALTALTATGASASTTASAKTTTATTVSAIDRGPAINAAQPCVALTFSTADAGTYEGCVKGEQTLLNGLTWFAPWPTIAEDGYYGSGTASVVKDFQSWDGITADGVTGPVTWDQLCSWGPDEHAYDYDIWWDVGCGDTGATPPPAP